MSVFKNLLSASYDGVPFLVPSENKSTGKKTVDHEYPGSNRRFVEELGQSPGIYSVTAIVHGADSIQQRISLEDALKKEGRGLLIHPSYGQVFVVATEFRSTSDDTEIGRFVFDITFKESEENITLQSSGTSVQLVSSIANNAKSSLDLAFLDKYTNVTTPFILQESTSQLLDVSSQVRDLGANLSDISQADLTTFNGVVEFAENVAPVVVRDGQGFISQVRDIYNAYENVSSNVSDYYGGYIGLTTYGNDRVAKPLTTAKRINEENNLSAFEDQTKINSLIGAYESAAYTDFQTEDELLTVSNQLEQAYDDISAQSDDDGLIFDPDVRSLLNELRVATRQIFETKEQNVWRVVDIDPVESSLALTSYQYYGDINNTHVLAELNPAVNYSIIDTDIKGVS